MRNALETIKGDLPLPELSSALDIVFTDLDAWFLEDSFENVMNAVEREKRLVDEFAVRSREELERQVKQGLATREEKEKCELKLQRMSDLVMTFRAQEQRLMDKLRETRKRKAEEAGEASGKKSRAKTSALLAA